ncbi:MAG: uncharacterized membrane protein YuzA (DUF378 family) [Natronomonas sp.]|jgi:uncharacterized membrane protein YuzA (DUF378 family)
MEGTDRFDSQPTPLEREANRWITILFGATFGFAIVGMLMGFGSFLNRSAYYVMVGFFLASLACALLTVPLLYITRDRRTGGR